MKMVVKVSAIRASEDFLSQGQKTGEEGGDVSEKGLNKV